MISGRRRILAKAALLVDLSVVVFIASGFSGILLLFYYPNEYSLWMRVVFAIPASVTGLLVTQLFRRAEKRWCQLGLAFWIEGKAAAWIMGSLVYVALALALNVTPDFGWVVFGLSGGSAVSAFVWVLTKWMVVRPKFLRATLHPS